MVILNQEGVKYRGHQQYNHQQYNKWSQGPFLILPTSLIVDSSWRGYGERLPDKHTQASQRQATGPDNHSYANKLPVPYYIMMCVCPSINSNVS